MLNEHLPAIYQRERERKQQQEEESQKNLRERRTRQMQMFQTSVIDFFLTPVNHDGHVRVKHRSANHKHKSNSLSTLHALSYGLVKADQHICIRELKALRQINMFVYES